MGKWQTHLMEDFQVWELIDPDTNERLPVGERGITVCTNMNSESSSQLRFVVGDYTTLDDSVNARAAAPTCARSAASRAAPTT